VRQGFPARSADPKDVTKSDSAWEVEWEITNPTNKPNSGTRAVERAQDHLGQVSCTRTGTIGRAGSPCCATWSSGSSLCPTTRATRATTT